MNHQTIISVVIPVYKADNCLDELYLRLTVSLECITSKFEIILIEDCGEDNSWSTIKRLANKDSRVHGIQFSRNFGQHSAITAGLDISKGNWVVVMDCDLQDRPEEIPRLYSKAQEGFDIVLARRIQRKDPFFKRVMSVIFYKGFSYLADIDYDGKIGNFRLISRKVVNNFCQMRERLRFFGGLIAWMGFSTTHIDVQHDARFSGKTSYTFRKLCRLASETVIAYSDKPLHLTIRFGLIISFFSFIYGSYIIYRGLLHDIPIIGWSSLIVSLYFLSGIIISILGIIGIYLGKAFDETKRRPLYIIRTTTFDETS